MIRESVEDYLGAVFRLRSDGTTPLPLSRLQDYFGFSRVSIHEMVQRLAGEGFLDYHPYRGVTLTEEGEEVAVHVLRRHRLWERFLTDRLGIPWDEAHEVAERLEHAASESVTERLSDYLGEPARCPHGSATHPERQVRGVPLSSVEEGTDCCILRVLPETSEVLRSLDAVGVGPSDRLRLVEHDGDETVLEVRGRVVELPAGVAETVWVRTAAE